MVFLAKIGIVNVAFLNRHRKYAILAAFVIAAVVTPTPDIVNQCLMAGPLLLLYEVSIVAVWLFGKRKFGGFEVVKSEESEDRPGRSLIPGMAFKSAILYLIPIA